MGNFTVLVTSTSHTTVLKVSVGVTGDLTGRGEIETLKAFGEAKFNKVIERVGPASAVALTTATAATYAPDPNHKYKPKQ